MNEADWDAWAATCDVFMRRRYFGGYWRRVRRTYNVAFQRFVDQRLSLPRQDP